ncbi:unnamed protein product [Cochlearia groenlandica]
MNQADATALEVEDGGGEREKFEAGKAYAVTLTTGIDFKGIVIAYDSVTNVVVFHILYRISSHGAIPNRGDSITTRIVKTKFIANLRYMGNVKDPLASRKLCVDLCELETKERLAIREIKRIGVCVTKEAQSIFDALSKSFSVEWDKKDILVSRDVRVCSPYNLDCVTGGTTATKNQVKKQLKLAREALGLDGK